MILSSARKLLTKKGIDGVTMRTLAKESGVAPKTLYHQFGSKEDLLRVAVEERFRYYYSMIDSQEVAHGIDRLYYIIDTVSATTRKNLAYATALTPMINGDVDSAFNQVRYATYRKAIDQIVAEDGFADGVNIELICEVVFRLMCPVFMASRLASTAWKIVPHLTKLEVSLILDNVTCGPTQAKAVATAKAMQKKLKSWKGSGRLPVTANLH